MNKYLVIEQLVRHNTYYIDEFQTKEEAIEYNSEIYNKGKIYKVIEEL